MLMARALKDVNLVISALKNVINPVGMEHSEVIASLYAVETVKIMRLVTGQMELA